MDLVPIPLQNQTTVVKLSSVQEMVQAQTKDQEMAQAQTKVQEMAQAQIKDLEMGLELNQAKTMPHI